MSSFQFELCDNSKGKEYRNYYPDLSTFGLHYTFKPLDSQGKPLKMTNTTVLRRHYTIANCMRPEFYNSLVSALKEEKQFNNSLCASKVTNMVNVTIKNYNLEKGLSRMFFKSPENQSKFYIKGPMGKGLGLSPSSKGSYCVFAAGTGILVFVDMIARIALGLLGAVPMAERLHEEFKLEIYYSARNKSEAVALDLLNSLSDYCAKHNLDKFKLTLRFSNTLVDDPNRHYWNKQFLDKQLSGKDFKQIYVCGPPSLEE